MDRSGRDVLSPDPVDSQTSYDIRDVDELDGVELVATEPDVDKLKNVSPTCWIPGTGYSPVDRRHEFQAGQLHTDVKPFDAHCCHMGTDIKHPVLDRVKPFVVCNF